MSSGSGAGSSRQVRRATPMMHGVLGSTVTSRRASLPREFDRPVGDDVLLHLGRATPDGAVALEGVKTCPLAPVDGVGTTLGEQASRAEQVYREGGHALRES